MYRERTSGLGAGSVVWSRTADGSAGRVLPDGCTDLIWSDAGAGGELFVAGPDTRAHLAAAPPGTRYVGLRFAPGTGPAVLGVPAHELCDRRVPLEALWSGPETRRLAGRLAEVAEAGSGDGTGTGGGTGAGVGGGTGAGVRAEDAGGVRADVGRVLEAAAAHRLRAAAPPDPALGAVVAGLSEGRPVAAVAEALGLGERQLYRRSLVAFGYGPKTLARVLRLQRALDAARAGTPYAEVAVLAGYADQPHLAREVRALAGVPLGLLLGPRPG